MNLSKELSTFLPQEEAQAETWRWMEEGLGRTKAWLLAHGQETMSLCAQTQIERWLERRRSGEPWAYIIGWCLFRGRRYVVDSNVLIPRPETELLLEAALDWGRRLKIRRIVDVGTGSGILALSLALETDWEIRATDLSENALEVAMINAQALGAQLHFSLGAFLDPVPDPIELVLSNPPYVDHAEAAHLQRELSFEPEMALFSPEGGLFHPLTILRQALQRRAMACLMEIGAGQGDLLKAKAKEMGYLEVMVQRDWQGHDRVLIALA